MKNGYGLCLVSLCSSCLGAYEGDLGELAPPPEWAVVAGTAMEQKGLVDGVAIAPSLNGGAFIAGSFQGSVTLDQPFVAEKKDLFVAEVSSTGTNWLDVYGSHLDDRVVDLVADESGDLYLTGSFGDRVTFGSCEIQSQGGTDWFVAKLDSHGDLRWVVSGGGGEQDTPSALTLDGEGGVYLAGTFRAFAAFGVRNVRSAGGTDAFFARLNAETGTVDWLIRAGGPSDDSGTGVATDLLGGIYFTGTFAATAELFGQSKRSRGGSDIFVSRATRQGGVAWTETAGGPSRDRSRAIVVSRVGVVVVTGEIESTAQFGTTALTTQGGSDVFIAELARGGGFQYAMTMGGPNHDQVTGLAADAEGSVYLSGLLSGTSQFGDYRLKSSGRRDLFLARYASRTINSALVAGGPGDDRAGRVAVAEDGQVLVAGSFQRTASFGGITLADRGDSNAVAWAIAPGMMP